MMTTMTTTRSTTITPHVNDNTTISLSRRWGWGLGHHAQPLKMYQGRIFPSPLVFDDNGQAQRCACFLFFSFFWVCWHDVAETGRVFDANGEGLTLPSCFQQRVGANVCPFYYYFSLGLLTLSGRVKPYAEHEKTPSLVSFHFRRCSIALQHTQSMKRHQQGVFSCSTLVPSHYSTRTWKDTKRGVFSCSALFLCPTTHAEQEKTPSLVSFRVWRCSFTLQHTLNMKRHLRWCSASFLHPLPHTPSTKAHPCWCFFLFGTFLNIFMYII